METYPNRVYVGRFNAVRCKPYVQDFNEHTCIWLCEWYKIWWRPIPFICLHHFPLVPLLPPNLAITPSSGWQQSHLSSAAVHKITHFKYWSDPNKPPYISLSPSDIQSQFLPEVRVWSPSLGGGEVERRMKGKSKGAWECVYPVEVKTDSSGCSLCEGMTQDSLSHCRDTFLPSLSLSVCLCTAPDCSIFLHLSFILLRAKKNAHFSK